MNLDEACRLLGVVAGTPEKQVRSAFHELMRTNHPDVASTTLHDSRSRIDPALLTEAYAIVIAELSTMPDRRVPPFPEPAASPSPQMPQQWGLSASHDGNTIQVDAPPDEAYQRLLDAAARLGGIGHVDRNLGLLEVIVRFEGGPSCSVLMTLQGRSYGTDIFCEMESIEAQPTPSIEPMLDALVELLSSPT